jgi:hypothetical protein
VSLAVALTAGLIAFLLHRRPAFWPDYVFPWQAARYLLAGSDPYQALHGALPEPFVSPLLYPLTTVLAAVPTSPLSLPLASAIMVALSSALLTYTLSRSGWSRLWILASAPFVMAVNLGQWSPLITVAALEPALGFLATLKPNLGLAALAYRPSLKTVIGSVAVLVLSVIVLPRWPLEWLRAVRSLPGHPAPILAFHGLGLVLALAVIRWRTPEGRLLLVSACVPQLLLFADQLPLLLVARTKRELMAMTALSQGAFVVWFAFNGTGQPDVLAATPYVLAFVYLPALAIVLRRRAGAAVDSEYADAAPTAKISP